jgi:hypothetical protein
LPQLRPDPDAVSLAFRLALSDAVPAGASREERCRALEAARDRLHRLVEAGAGLPELAGELDRAFLLRALQKGFEQAWEQLTGRPW